MPFEKVLQEQFGVDAFTYTQFRDNRRVIVPVEKLLEVLRCLREKGSFDQLVELTAADYLNYPGARDRYGVVYILVNTTSGERAIVKTMVNDPEPTVPSVFSLWKGANWLEREVYDMYGIVFKGHPDLRRILMPEEFTSYPLRRDYPMRGRGERHNFPVITRAES